MAFLKYVLLVIWEIKQRREETQTHLEMQKEEDTALYESKWLKHGGRMPPEYLSWHEHQ